LKLELFADYYQFYLQDDDLAVGDFSDAWNREAVCRVRIAVVPGCVAIATARNTTVRVELVFSEVEPALAHDSWSHIVEADMLCNTGRIVVAGCTDYFPDARRCPVKPGRHRVRVFYGFGTRAADGFGDLMDYRVDVWPIEAPRPVVILKQGPFPWSG